MGSMIGMWIGLDNVTESWTGITVGLEIEITVDNITEAFIWFIC